jgi:stage III sporulation protein AF
MDGLKSWGLAVCFAALAAGIASIIAPSGKMEKIYKFAVSLFFLCCLLVPLFSLKNIIPKKIEIETRTSSQNEKLVSAAQDSAGNLALSNLKSMIQNVCSEENITPVNITADIKKDNNGALNIDSITVILKRKDMLKSDKIVNAVKDKYGITVKIAEGED